MKSTGIGAQFQGIVASRGGSMSSGYMLYSTTTCTGSPTFTFQIGVGSRRYVCDSSGQTLENGRWYHVVGSFDGTNLHIYVNGVEVTGDQLNDGTGTIFQPNTVYSLLVGKTCNDCGGGTAWYWAGSMDEVAVYPRALSSSEVAQHYADAFGITQPPELSYGTCDGTGVHAITPSGCLSDPVNTLTGAFTESAEDLALPGRGVSFAWARSYTSADSTVGRLGPGWTDSYAVSLAVQPNADVILHGDEGQRVTFAHQPDGSFEGAAGSRSRLTSIPGGYRLTRHDQVVYEFDPQGRLTSEKDRNGQGLTFAYDGQGRLASITDATSRTFTVSYNASSLVSSVALPDGRSVLYGYTAGRLTSVSLPDPDDTGPLTRPVWTYSYDAGGRLATVVDPLQHTQITNVYDPTTGRVTQQTDANQKTTLFAWDPATQIATVTDANQHVWKDDYENNVLVKRIDATSKETVFGHDTDLNATAVTSPNGTDTTAMTYDDAGNLLTATAPASLGSAQKTFTYTSQNNVDTVTDARSKVTDYSYDPAGNNTSITLEGQSVFGATYDAQGQLQTSTDGNGKTTTYTYNATTGLLETVTAPDPDGNGSQAASVTKYTHSYTAAGEVMARIDPLGMCQGCSQANYTTTYSYDALGRLVSETDPLNHTGRAPTTPPAI